MCDNVDYQTSATAKNNYSRKKKLIDAKKGMECTNLNTFV